MVAHTVAQAGHKAILADVAAVMVAHTVAQADHRVVVPLEVVVAEAETAAHSAVVETVACMAVPADHTVVAVVAMADHMVVAVVEMAAHTVVMVVWEDWLHMGPQVAGPVGCLDSSPVLEGSM